MSASCTGGRPRAPGAPAPRRRGAPSPRLRPPLARPLPRAKAGAPPGDGQTRGWRGSQRRQIAGARCRGAALRLRLGAAREACRCPWPPGRRPGDSFAGAQSPAPRSTPAPRDRRSSGRPVGGPLCPSAAPAARSRRRAADAGPEARSCGRACFPAAARPRAAPARPVAALRSAPPGLGALRWIYEWGEEATCRRHRRRLVLTAPSPGPRSSGCRESAFPAPAAARRTCCCCAAAATAGKPLPGARRGRRAERGPSE